MKLNFCKTQKQVQKDHKQDRLLLKDLKKYSSTENMLPKWEEIWEIQIRRGSWLPEGSIKTKCYFLSSQVVNKPGEAVLSTSKWQ